MNQQRSIMRQIGTWTTRLMALQGTFLVLTLTFYRMEHPEQDILTIIMHPSHQMIARGGAERAAVLIFYAAIAIVPFAWDKIAHWIEQRGKPKVPTSQ